MKYLVIIAVAASMLTGVVGCAQGAGNASSSSTNLTTSPASPGERAMTAEQTPSFYHSLYPDSNTAAGACWSAPISARDACTALRLHRNGGFGLSRVFGHSIASVILNALGSLMQPRHLFGGTPGVASSSVSCRDDIQRYWQMLDYNSRLISTCKIAFLAGFGIGNGLTRNWSRSAVLKSARRLSFSLLTLMSQSLTVIGATLEGTWRTIKVRRSAEHRPI
jgi:hypothetical protein